MNKEEIMKYLWIQMLKIERRKDIGVPVGHQVGNFPHPYRIISYSASGWTLGIMRNPNLMSKPIPP